MKNLQLSKPASSVDTLNRICESLFSCTHTDLDALMGPAKNTGKGTQVLPGKAFLVVEFQFSRLPYKMMLKNSVLTTQGQMNSVARTLSNMEIRYIAWSAIWLQ
jgi:hypothetical protein